MATKAQAQVAIGAAARVRDARGRYAREASREEIQEGEKSAKAAERIAERKRRAEEKAQKKIRDERIKFMKGIGATALGAFGGLSLSSLVGRGVDLAGASVRESVKLDEMARRGAINAGLAGQKLDPAALRRQFENAAISNPGQKSEDIAQAFLSYQAKTGKALGASETGMLATVSSGSGANIADVAETAASLSKQLDITGLKDMQEALSILTVQGAEGAVEFKDMAKQFDRLTAAAGTFGIGKGVGAVASLGGLFQLTREATGGPEQATTALERMFAKFQDPSVLAKLKSEGVSVYDQKGQAKPIQDVLLQTIAGVGGKDTVKKRGELAKMFDTEGMKAIAPLLRTFIDATAAGADGMAAMRRKLEDVTNTTDAVARVNQAAATAQESAGARLSASWEKLKQQVGDDLVPKLIPLVDEFVSMSGAAKPVVKELGYLANSAKFLARLINRLTGKDEDADTRTHGQKIEDAQAELDQIEMRRGNSLNYKTDADAKKAKELRQTIAEEKELTKADDIIKRVQDEAKDREAQTTAFFAPRYTPDMKARDEEQIRRAEAAARGSKEFVETRGETGNIEFKTPEEIANAAKGMDEAAIAAKGLATALITAAAEAQKLQVQPSGLIVPGHGR